MEELIKKHAIVKDHKYRIARDKRYAKSYGLALDNLIREFDKEIKKTSIRDRKGIWFFFHEALSNAWHFKMGDKDYAQYYPDGKTMNTDIMFAVEYIIGDIHNFIRTGEFDKYHTYYDGTNTRGRIRQSVFVWNPKTEVYERSEE